MSLLAALHPKPNLPRSFSQMWLLLYNFRTKRRHDDDGMVKQKMMTVSTFRGKTLTGRADDLKDILLLSQACAATGLYDDPRERCAGCQTIWITLTQE